MAQDAGLILMGVGNITAIYSATCSSFFSTDKFSREDEEDVDRAIAAGALGLILACMMIYGAHRIYQDTQVTLVLFLFALMIFILYYDVVTDKFGIWTAMKKFSRELKKMIGDGR